MKFKLLMIALLLFGVIACSNDWPTYVNVQIDNRTNQDFIVVVDGYQRATLIAGGVDNVLVGDSTREYQLRWIDKNGVNVLYIPLCGSMKKIFIQGCDGDYIIEIS